MSVVLVTIVIAGAISDTSERHRGSAAELGSTIGATLLEAIELQAKARMWEQPACDDYPPAPEVKEICAALDKASDLFLEIGERGGPSQEPYDQTAEYHLLRALEEGIANKDAFIRFQTLALLETLCRGPALGDLGQNYCGSESEQAALRILSEDDNHLNRHLALQILASGRATAQSREVLSAMVRGKKTDKGDCPEILPGPKSSVDRLPIVRIVEGFENGTYSCERALAVKALATIKDTK